MIKKILGLLVMAAGWAGGSSAALLQQTSPTAVVYVEGTDFGVFTGTGLGDVTANVVAVDVVLALPRSPVTSGCEAADFAGFVAGSIALIQRGGCLFSEMALNAEAAGAVGVIIFNQGNTPAREGLIVGTLGGPGVAGIPVMGVSFWQGYEWATSTAPVTLRMVVT